MRGGYMRFDLKKRARQKNERENEHCGRECGVHAQTLRQTGIPWIRKKAKVRE